MEERRVTIVGHEVAIRGDRSALLTRSRELLVGDLHLGRPESAQARGLAVPAAAPREELERLTCAVAASDAVRLIVLGDLFHDPRAITPERRDELVAALLAAAGVPVELVRGNHDRVDGTVLERLGLVVRERAISREGLILHHGYEPSGDTPTIAGHLHPVAMLTAPGERLRLPCFVVREQSIVLPAFGRFTGGAVVGRSPDARRFAVLDGALIDLDARTR